MEQTIQTTLKKWEASLTSFGKIDQWSINEDYSIICQYLSSPVSKESRNAVRDCRDYSIRDNFDSNVLLSKVRNANRLIMDSCDSRINQEMKKNSIGQAKRFESTTKKLFSEKLRFMNGECLRNIDIEMEDGATTRKVRRIVEKRMCQAYYRQNGINEDRGNRDRHYMKRATSFQLHNLGQVENIKGVCRTDSTHWKRSYDPITGEVVFKKKVSYSTLEEAEEAAILFEQRHPSDKVHVTAYKCAYCGKYHIGHTSENKDSVESLVTLSRMAS